MNSKILRLDPSPKSSILLNTGAYYPFLFRRTSNTVKRDNPEQGQEDKNKEEEVKESNWLKSRKPIIKK